MTPTTRYGTWVTVMGASSTDPDQEVIDYLAEGAGDYDIDATCAAYRRKLNALLPGSLQLIGDEFIGDLGDKAITEDWRETFRDAVQGEDHLDAISDANRWVDLHLYVQHHPDGGTPGENQCIVTDRIHFEDLPRTEAELRDAYEESQGKRSRVVDGDQWRIEARFAFLDDPGWGKQLSVTWGDLRDGDQ